MTGPGHLPPDRADRSTQPSAPSRTGVPVRLGGTRRAEPNRRHQRETDLLGGVSVPSVPELALPKGGGAIRGIGEKFQVSPATGTASLTVPVGLTPGRGSATPELALRYDSGHGNGPFGLGWSIGAGSIARRTDKRLPRYLDDGPDADIFVLAGVEDLVPALVDDGIGELRIDEQILVDGAVTFRVRRYQPRVESGYARIERWTGLDGDTHWRVTARDNHTMVFGSTSQGRLADPADPRRVFEWLAQEYRDDRGNVVSYEYASEDTRGVDPALAHEGNRLGRPGGAARYLKRVRYANTVPDVADGWLLEFVVDYGDHTAPVPTPEPDQPWPVRPDPFSTYRPGFEVRTWRRAARLLMFHRFPELGADPVLVHSTELDYLDEPTGSLLRAVTSVGWARDAQGQPVNASVPPVEFEYTQARIDPTVRELDPDSAVNLPVGLTGGYTFVDLDGEGLAGILTEQAGEWFYKRNLGGGQFASAGLVATRPLPTQLAAGRQQLLDLDGDGRRSLVSLRPELPGYFDRTDQDGWDRFVAFGYLPRIDWTNPNLRFVDLDGDGHIDVLITGDDVFTWYASAGRDGFGDYQNVGAASDELDGPRLVFRNEAEAILLADMSGDGPADLVRVRASEVCYWPSLGYGRFGPKVTMSQAPLLDEPDQFDPRRVRLADVDGSGTADLVYLHRDGVRLYLNACGNGYVGGQTVTSLPHLTNLDEVAVLDLLGTGTGALVWSTPLPADTGRSLRYLDLMADGKPYLLRRSTNNMGATTTTNYAPSTEFYRADARDGLAWATRLPFPVQCVASVTIADEVTGTQLVTGYRYHHGYYDRVEREFRGFAYVEQTDAETFGTARGAGRFTDATPTGGTELTVAPVLTRQWFHTGLDPARGDMLAVVHASAFGGDPHALRVPPPVLPEAGDREAHRALKGQPLRTEVYALDDPTGAIGVPYQVTDHQAVVRALHPARPDLGVPYPVFDVHDGQSLTHHYERDPADPRVTTHLTLAVDDYGAVTASADIGYPRRSGQPDALDEQAVPAVTAIRRAVTNQLTRDGYRLGVLTETVTYQVTGLPIGASTPAEPAAILDALDHAPRLEYLDSPPAGVSVRTIEQVRVLYRGDDLASPLPLGQVGDRGLVHETYLLALTPSIIAEVYGPDLDPATFGVDGGYTTSTTPGFPATDASGTWWLPSGQATYDPDQFYQPTAHRDPFGHTTTIEYAYALAPVATTDPVGNTVRSDLNFRVLAPGRVTDPNGEVSTAAFDALGRLVGTAMAGDTLANFVSDLSPDVIEAHLDDPLADPAAILGAATTRIVYHLGRTPAVAYTLAREQHAVATSPVQHTFGYTDGLGQEVMRKVRAEAGLAPWRDTDGVLHTDPARPTDQRWVGTGRIVRNNKGNPVKRYEPFFSDSQRYETEPELVEAGVTALLTYDPIGRLVRTEHPDGTTDDVTFTPWRASHADGGDNVAGSRWFADRTAPGTDPRDQAAASASLAYAGTPTVTHTDALGRTVRTVLDNGSATYTTAVTLDIEGNERVVTDARGVVVQRSTYDMLGTPLLVYSADAGTSRTVTDVLDQPLLVFTSRGYRLRHTYDPAHRPLDLLVRDPGSAVERVTDRIVYGESANLPADQITGNRLRGHTYQVYDDSGLVTHQEYDPHGLLRVSVRTFLADASAPVDWQHGPALSTEELSTTTDHDALGRVVHHALPTGYLIAPGYNEAGSLERIDVTTPDGDTNRYVTNINYDAKGQRVSIAYGNGAVTNYSYDPLSYRLTGLVTSRGDGATLQDLGYHYDPVGNLTSVIDAAQPDVFFRGTVATASAGYTYDPLYRLVTATGREHPGQVTANPDASTGLRPQYDHNDAPRLGLPHPNDGNAVQPYTERYTYDEVGNITTVDHSGQMATWHREYRYAADSDRLLSTTLPDDTRLGTGIASAPDRYGYDAHGNITAMPHLSQLDWDHAERLGSVRLAGGAVSYAYDDTGHRARAVVQQGGVVVQDRLYLDGLEIQRTYSARGELIAERYTLHVMDGTRRIALVDTRTVDRADSTGLGTPVPRYQLGNHLDSACLELDATRAAIISYEEYYPFGATSYQAGPNVAEVSRKRYRYTGRERDDETGFTYHHGRYYAPWLGRWTSPDPAGLVDGTNRYQYVGNNPMRYVDTQGTAKADPDGVVRQPGSRGITVYRTKDGIRILREPTTTLATDPAFQGPARDALAATKVNDYNRFRDNLNGRIRQILAGNSNHSLKLLLEVRSVNGRSHIFWKAGTAFAGQKLNFAHVIAQQSIKNLGAHTGTAISLENLNPVGKKFHLKDYGHVEEFLTKSLSQATPQAKQATRVVAKELGDAVTQARTIRSGEAGTVTIGGLLFIAVTTGLITYIVATSKDKPAALKRAGAEFALNTVGAQLAGRFLGLATIGGLAASFLTVRSDNPVLNEQYEVAEAFVRANVPEAVSKRWWGESIDQQAVNDAVQLLFYTKPIELK